MARTFTEGQRAARAVMSVMKDWPLEPGQMLFMGPQSVAILSQPGAYNGQLPDTFVLDRREWSTDPGSVHAQAEMQRDAKPKAARKATRKVK